MKDKIEEKIDELLDLIRKNSSDDVNNVMDDWEEYEIIAEAVEVIMGDILSYYYQRKKNGEEEI